MSHDVTELPEWSQAWAKRRLAQHSVSGHEATREQWTGLRDWLASLPNERPRMVGKLHKLTLEQALLAQARWHDELARRSQRLASQRQGFGGDPLAVEVIATMASQLNPAGSPQAQGWQWVRVTTPAGLDYEGAAMGHCVGGGGYDEGATIYSLRDGDNMPHCTIEWKADTRVVNQVQGRANGSVVSRYHPAVVAFVNALQPSMVKGAGKFAHVLVEGKLVHVTQLQPNTTIRETLDLSGCTELVSLPRGLHVQGCLFVHDCVNLQSLPEDLVVDNLLMALRCTSLTKVSAGTRVAGGIDLDGCTALVELPADMHVKGRLDIRGCTSLRRLPANLRIDGDLYIRRCTALEELPADIKANAIDAIGCESLTEIPDNLVVEYLHIRNCTALERLGNNIKVREFLDMSGCSSLKRIGFGLYVGQMISMGGCTSLESLPSDIQAGQLDLNNCSALLELPDNMRLRGYLDLIGCTALSKLPNNLRIGRSLYLQGCAALTSIPDDLEVDDDIVGADQLLQARRRAML